MRKHSKLVVVTSYPIHSEPVVRNRLSSYIQELSSAGWQISLVTLDSGPEGRTEESLPSGLADVKYVSPTKYDKSNFFSRGINEVKIASRILRAAYQIDADAYLVTIPSVFMLLFLKNKNNCINIIDVRDLVWEYLPNKPIWKRFIKLCLKTFATKALKKGDMLTVSNPGELEYLKENVPGSNCVLVSNGIGIDQFQALSKLAIKTEKEKVLRITYVGNVGLAQNLKTLIHAVAGCPELEVNIIGGGTDYPNVQAEIQKNNATNVFLHGRIPWKDVISWYKKTDVLYAQLSEGFETAMPSKLYEYLSTGLPVIYGGRGTAFTILNMFENVKLIEPDSPEELKSALLEKYLDPEIKRSKKNIKIIKDNFIREDQVRRFVAELDKLNL